jgi:murein DD-endopeptidase MepM/ murein hydrolase activator NlpD
MNARLRRFLPLLCLYFLMACSHMVRSGHYVQVDRGDSWASLAREFGTTEAELKEANPRAVIEAGQWLFVPTTAGLINAPRPNIGRKVAEQTEEFLDTGRFLWPVPSSKRISSPFGPRWGRHHDGIDIPGRPGSHILATDDGVVVYSGNELGGYGNIIVISHEGGYFSVYAHNKSNSVRRGQRVHRGQVVGLLGSTGNSTGPHLHFEIRRDSRAIDPKRVVTMR